VQGKHLHSSAKGLRGLATIQPRHSLPEQAVPLSRGLKKTLDPAGPSRLSWYGRSSSAPAQVPGRGHCPGALGRSLQATSIRVTGARTSLCVLLRHFSMWIPRARRDRGRRA